MSTKARSAQFANFQFANQQTIHSLAITRAKGVDDGLGIEHTQIFGTTSPYPIEAHLWYQAYTRLQQKYESLLKLAQNFEEQLNVWSTGPTPTHPRPSGHDPST